VFSAFVNNKRNIRTKIFLLKNANSTSIYFIFNSYLKFIEIIFQESYYLQKNIQKVEDALLFHIVLEEWFVSQMTWLLE